MKLGEKIGILRGVKAGFVGLNRERTHRKILGGIRKKRETTTIQSNLSKLKKVPRPHLTNTTRMLLAKFFKVHPGYLVDDPEGYHTELISDVRTLEERLDLWLIAGAERFRRGPQVKHALLLLAKHADSRGCLVLLGAILETPGLAERLLQVLKPETGTRTNGAAKTEEIL